MSNNIYKANFIQFSTENTKVIDTNSLVAKRLEGFSGVLREKDENEELTEEETEGMDPLTMAELLADRDSSGNEVISEETPEDVAEAIRQMKADAEAEIEEIKETARNDIEAMRKEAYDRAEAEGYAAGEERCKAEYNLKLAQLEQERKDLDEQYQDMANKLEGRVVDAVTDIYKKVFGDHFYNRRDVILTLVSKALYSVGNVDDIIIHVSAGDYEAVMEKRDELFETEDYRRAPEIRAEERYEAGQCKVETQYGIIDCSIDTELKELAKALHMLSYGDKRS